MKVIQAAVICGGQEAWLDVVRIEGPMLTPEATDAQWLAMAERDFAPRKVRLIELIEAPNAAN